MPAAMVRRFGAGRSSVIGWCILAAVIVLGPGAGRGTAVEIPPLGGFYIQTSGPNAGPGIGDWYSSTAVGAGSGFHYLAITVPCGWPTLTPLYIDLFSPEMNQIAGALGLGDEQRGANYDSTQFELYLPPVTIGPGYASPPPGPPSIYQVTYLTSAVAEAWVRFATLVPPVACGTYVLRSAVLTNPPGEGDDDNGWRLRVGTDNDADPTNVPPANSDNLDGLPGTNDEIIIGQVQITYQHDTGGVACLTLYEYVPPGLPTVTFHNFDMDDNTRVTYYDPSDVYDPTGQVGGTAGTLSSNSQWNQGTLDTRVGDTLANPEAGWWRIVSCLTSTNQFIQESQDGIGAHFAQPPTPVLTIAKTDGTTVATAGGNLTYTVTVTNTSSGPTAGAALAVVVVDAVPTNATFQSCTIVAPATGSCSESLGVVTATLNGWINAGASAEVQVTVTVDANASGTVSDLAQATYEDALGNAFPEVTATDVDTVSPLLPDASMGSVGAETDGPFGTGMLVGIVVAALVALGLLNLRAVRRRGVGR